MKKLIIALPLLTFFFFSCGGGCDTSTPEAAADCYCELIAEKEEADAAGDEEAMKDIDARGEAWEDEIEEHIDAGDYTEIELSMAMIGAGCN